MRSITPTISGSADRKSTGLNSSHGYISYAVFCLKKKKNILVTHSLVSKQKMIRNIRTFAIDCDRDSEFKVEAEVADLLGLLDQADRVFFVMIGRLPSSTLFPYTTLYG